MKREIIENFKKLSKEFYRIQCKNWIQGTANGTGAAGKTLEHLLGKCDDTYSLPDYYGIELKTKTVGSFPYVGLFSMALDSAPLIMQHLWEKYGWSSKTDSRFRYFYTTLYGNKYVHVGKIYSFKLKVDYFSSKLRLCIYNNWSKKLDDTMSWSFDQLKLRLETKLSYLAFVHVRRWYMKDLQKYFFKYTDITFYHLKSFDQFLKMIEEGKIRVEIKLMCFKSGKLIGNMNDKGTTFVIEEPSLQELFDVIKLDEY